QPSRLNLFYPPRLLTTSPRGCLPSQPLQEIVRGRLLLPVQHAHEVLDAVSVGRKDVPDQLLASAGQRRISCAAVSLARTTFDEPLPFQPVDQVRHTPARHQDLALHFPEQQRALVVEDLE